MERWSPPRPPRSEELNPSRAALRQMEQENRRYPANSLLEVPRAEWPPFAPAKLIRVLRSRDFMVQVYQEADDIIRLSVQRCAYDLKSGRWKDGISWDDLQHLKNLAGFSDRAAVELYPPLASEVNVANLRHLFVLPEPPAFMWNSGRAAA